MGLKDQSGFDDDSGGNGFPNPAPVARQPRQKGLPELDYWVIVIRSTVESDTCGAAFQAKSNASMGAMVHGGGVPLFGRPNKQSRPK
jgi:hypothetical protein